MKFTCVLAALMSVIAGLASADDVSSAKVKATNCNENVADYVVIGAGVSGMTAAYELRKAGKCVLVVEAQNTVGGLCRNVNLGSVRDRTQPNAPVVGTNVQISVGGSYYDIDKEPNLVYLIDALGLSALQYPNFTVNFATSPLPLAWPASLLAQNPADYEIFGTMYGIGATFPSLAAAPPQIQALQGTPLESYLTFAFPSIPYNATSKQMVRDFVQLQSTQDFDKVDAYTICKLIATVVPVASGPTFPVGANTNTVYQLTFGTGQLTSVLKKALSQMGVIFRLGTSVTAINSKVQSKPIIISAKNRRHRVVIRARKNVILTVAPSQAKKIKFTPALSKSTVNVMKGSPVNDNLDIQVFAFFKNPWWFGLNPIRSPAVFGGYAEYAKFLTNPGLAPKLYGYAAPVPPVKADQPQALGWGVIRLFVSPKLFKSKPATLRQDVLAFLALYGQNIPESELMDVKVFDWGTLEGSIQHTFFGPGTLLNNLGAAYLQENGGVEGRIGFAGTMTATTWSVWLEGAVESGRMIAQTLLSTV